MLSHVPKCFTIQVLQKYKKESAWLPSSSRELLHLEKRLEGRDAGSSHGARDMKGIALNPAEPPELFHRSRISCHPPSTASTLVAAHIIP